MPIYGYRCGQCGHELEVFQSMSDEPLQVCDRCGGRLRKLLYPVGVHFKGSGFYTTDYKGGGNGSGPGADGSDRSSGSDRAEKAESQAEPVGSKDA
ncbi:MAG TPA: FmdB family zinc ribbon protein [Candidatus Dormibacteraeota bacterium]|nr:FmdB family zinc ribbon protein [Candidatus Dormibacteraeota bacterium]